MLLYSYTHNVSATTLEDNQYARGIICYFSVLHMGVWYVLCWYCLNFQGLFTLLSTGTKSLLGFFVSAFSQYFITIISVCMTMENFDGNPHVNNSLNQRCVRWNKFDRNKAHLCGDVANIVKVYPRLVRSGHSTKNKCTTWSVTHRINDACTSHIDKASFT